MSQSWDIAGSFNEGAKGGLQVDQGLIDKAGQVAAGKALMQMFNPPVPGAQPMPGGPQQPGQPPQGSPQGGDILSRLKGLFQQPQQSPGGGGQPGMPPQPMPGQQPQMPQRPPMQAPVPGAQPMGGPQGAPMQPQSGGSMPPQSQASAPPGMGGGQAPTGMLDWKSVVQQVKAANPGADPRVIMTAVNQFLPLMTQQAQMEWKQVMMQTQRDRTNIMGERADTAREQGGERIGIAQQQADTSAKRADTSADQGQQRIDLGKQR